jgi:hypothetical protein
MIRPISRQSSVREVGNGAIFEMDKLSPASCFSFGRGAGEALCLGMGVGGSHDRPGPPSPPGLCPVGLPRLGTSSLVRRTDWLREARMGDRLLRVAVSARILRHTRRFSFSANEHRTSGTMPQCKALRRFVILSFNSVSYDPAMIAKPRRQLPISFPAVDSDATEMIVTITSTHLRYVGRDRASGPTRVLSWSRTSRRPVTLRIPPYAVPNPSSKHLTWPRILQVAECPWPLATLRQ